MNINNSLRFWLGSDGPDKKHLRNKEAKELVDIARKPLYKI